MYILLQDVCDYSLFSSAAQCTTFVSEVLLKESLCSVAHDWCAGHLRAFTFRSGLQILQSQFFSAARSSARGRRANLIVLQEIIIEQRF